MLQLSSWNRAYFEYFFKRLKVLTGAIVFTLVFSLVLTGDVLHDGFPLMVILTYLQLEIFLWLGFRFFNGGTQKAPWLKKQIIVRLLVFYTLVLAIATLIFIAVFYVQNRHQYTSTENFIYALSHFDLEGFLLATIAGFALGTLFFFYEQWSEALKREQQLMQEKLIFQYETLKAQVNPHFLFNSLNTLASLVRTDTALSELYIQKFSGIYRYILDNQEKSLVPLAAELGFVHNYFMLQMIRDENKIDLQTEIDTLDGVEVVPVSLQLLVENALKHNSATRKQPLVITIGFEGKNTLVVKNKLQPKTSLNSSSGSGLKNLDQRCRLTLNRNIEVLNTKTEFIVKIPVKISHQWI